MTIFQGYSTIPQVTSIIGEEPKWAENQLKMGLLGLGAVNPWCGNDSSPRIQMLLSQIGQALVVDGTNLKRCLTGIEFELAKSTLSRKLPNNGRIIEVIEKYPRTVGMDRRVNPLTVVIYEDYETQEIGHVELPRFSCLHQHYGFPYVQTPLMDKVVRGNHVPGGQPLLDTPTVDENGAHCIGVDVEIAYMSIPPVIEDGIVLSEEAVRLFTSKGYEHRIMNWGKKRYPISLYDDPNKEGDYKPYPEIGDRIRPDGLLFSTRTYDDLLAPVEMDEVGVRTPDYIYDKTVYAVPNAKIMDVTVSHDTVANVPPTPVGMEVATQRHLKSSNEFYNKVFSTYSKLKYERKEKLQLKPEFHRLVVMALGDRVEPKRRVVKTYRNVPIDDWWVKVDFEYDVVPTVGFKFTGNHGNKGVVCDVWPTEHMPISASGVRSHMIMEGESIAKRMNPGALYEQYINAASRDLSKSIRRMYGLDPVNPTSKDIDAAVRSRTDLTEPAFLKLLSYYWVCSPKMGNGIEERYLNGTFDPVTHLKAVLKSGIYLWTPTDTPISYMDVTRLVRDNFPPEFGPVSYMGASGKIVTTKSSVLIGSVQMMMLEKTATDWSGVSSAKLQHFGVPAKLTNADKFSQPGRGTPVRIAGEAELRAWAATCGGDTGAELLDQSNNPRVHKHIQRNIIMAPKPTDIATVVDRALHPIGNGRNLVFPRNTMECAGIRFVKKDMNDDSI